MRRPKKTPFTLPKVHSHLQRVVVDVREVLDVHGAALDELVVVVELLNHYC